jgi:hypothetical protein
MDSFAPHKNTSTNTKAGKSSAALAKFKAKERIQAELKEELLLQNTTLSIIPGGGTGYV